MLQAIWYKQFGVEKIFKNEGIKYYDLTLTHSQVECVYVRDICDGKRRILLKNESTCLH